MGADDFAPVDGYECHRAVTSPTWQHEPVPRRITRPIPPLGNTIAKA
ncbi:hypothetical protein ACH44C_03420 [Streptomyces purpureus]